MDNKQLDKAKKKLIKFFRHHYLTTDDVWRLSASGYIVKSLNKQYKQIGYTGFVVSMRESIREKDGDMLIRSVRTLSYYAEGSLVFRNYLVTWLDDVLFQTHADLLISDKFINLLLL